MLMYAMAVLPLIKSLKSEDPIVQNWYADDASAIGNLEHVKVWIEKLIQRGPAYGYFPEPQKSYLVVSPDYVEKAKLLFTGHRFLGGFVGDDAGNALYVQKKFEQWCEQVKRLSKIADNQPQAAFAGFTKSLQCEWNYLQRVVAGSGHLFDSLERIITDEFLPAVFGSEISPEERTLFSMPTQNGGIGVHDPSKSTETAYNASRGATKVVIDAIKGKKTYNSQDHKQQMQRARTDMKNDQKEKLKVIQTAIMEKLDKTRQRAVQRIINYKTSSWLTVLPVAKHQFDMSALEFRDALALRYRRALKSIPALCDGCGDRFSLEHSLSWKKGGLIIQRHNEIRDAIGDLADLVWHQVHREPVVREANDSNNIRDLIADLGVRGVWEAQTTALFDIRITDTDAQSYLSRPVEAVLSYAETEKKRKYGQACKERRASFTPIVASVDGALGKEASFFLKHLSERLAIKWQQKYSDVV
jgi:hypothetical protein